jgi:RNA polymerase sigma-70 factor (ECF subfamily)
VFEAEALPHFDLVHRAARRLAGDGSWAKDLTQEVFLQAWKSFDRFEPGTNCKAWLMAILFHICQHHRRCAWRNQSVSWRPEHDALVACQPVESSRLADGTLLTALNMLPSWYKRVLVLAEVYEYSYSEISAMLGVPIGTVMSRLSRGKKQMREHLSAKVTDVESAIMRFGRAAGARRP